MGKTMAEKSVTESKVLQVSRGKIINVDLTQMKEGSIFTFLYKINI